MSTTNRKEILDLLASGKISAEEASELLSALSTAPEAPEPPEKPLKVEIAAAAHTAAHATIYWRATTTAGRATATTAHATIHTSTHAAVHW